MQVNLCVNCKHHLYNKDYHIDYCKRKPYIDPVHGLTKYQHCITERDPMGTCTYQGIHFERK